ncbi:MAG TPA: NAD-binding protein [bacterium]|nr:NAD-binding protein [bacterium]
MTGFRQLRGPVIVLVLTLALGTAGYMVIEGWSFMDALFMTVITVTTVGYNEVRPLSLPGRVFTIVLIFVGVGGVLYTLGALFTWLLSINWSEQRRRRKMDAELAGLTNHFIVCGYGRVGRRVAQVFRRERSPVVVVDADQTLAAAAEADGFPVVCGDAASDQVLTQARVDRARGLVTVTGSDANNVYIVLSARVLRPDLLIVARADADDAIEKLRRAGASQVLSLYHIAGQRLAMIALRPAAVEFVETVLHTGREQLMLEEVTIVPGSRLAEMSLGVLREQSAGVVIVALYSGGQLIPLPRGEHVLGPGDKLVLLGRREELQQIEALS